MRRSVCCKQHGRLQPAPEGSEFSVQSGQSLYACSWARFLNGLRSCSRGCERPSDLTSSSLMSAPFHRFSFCRRLYQLLFLVEWYHTLVPTKELAAFCMAGCAYWRLGAVPLCCWQERKRFYCWQKPQSDCASATQCHSDGSSEYQYCLLPNLLSWCSCEVALRFGYTCGGCREHCH